MTRSTSMQHRRAQWRERLARQARSGQGVAAFCKSEGIPTQTFYWWRARLARDDGEATACGGRPGAAAPFIDLGALGAAASAAGFELRLDLPGGIVLTIARR